LSIHLKGLSDSDVGYLQTLSIYNGAHPISLPVIDTSIKDPISFAIWLFHVEKYYSFGGTVCLRTLLGEHFLTLTQSIDFTKFPLNRLDTVSVEYHLGYIFFAQRKCLLA